MTEIEFILKLWFGDTSKFSNYGVQSFCSHKNRAISKKLKILEFKTISLIWQVLGNLFDCDLRYKIGLRNDNGAQN